MPRKPGPGRPKGEPVDDGEVKTIRRVKRALRERGEDDPAVQWCLERLVDIASGKRRVRHVQEEFRAIREILDRTQGRPAQKTELVGEVEHKVIVEYADD